MTQEESRPKTTKRNQSVSSASAWHYHPELPIRNSPVFAWPPQLWTASWFLLRSTFFAVDRLMFLAFALLTWWLLKDGLASVSSLSLGWATRLYSINLIMMVFVAGGLHLYFYRFVKQAKHLKFTHTGLESHHPRYLFGNQTWDNITWTLVSGVTIWTAYELLVLTAFANRTPPTLSLSAHPFWFLAGFPLVILWYSVHFYTVHRVLHSRVLYRRVHAVHHRNVSIGPWSGISMHPIEHLLYFSSLLIHLIVPSHPIHFFFHMYWLSLGAVTSHCGYESLLVNGQRWLVIGDFHHQLHHSYFRCNYGSADVPCDAWAGSFHDGTAESTRRVRPSAIATGQTM